MTDIRALRHHIPMPTLRDGQCVTDFGKEITRLIHCQNPTDNPSIRQLKNAEKRFRVRRLRNSSKDQKTALPHSFEWWSTRCLQDMTAPSTNLPIGTCHLSQLQSMMLQGFIVFITRIGGKPVFQHLLIMSYVTVLAAAAQYKSDCLDRKIR